jgi:hypothetical protein
MNLNLDLRCSSDSFKFELQSSVSHNNGEVAGFWNELTHKVGGTVAGTAAGERIEVRVDGPIAALPTSALAPPSRSWRSSRRATRCPRFRSSSAGPSGRAKGHQVSTSASVVPGLVPGMIFFYGLRFCAFQYRSRFEISAGLKWQ